jgi:outer membrane immunogenic protein
MKSAAIVSVALIVSTGAFAADTGPVVTPGPFNAPPAYPKVVTPGPFDAPPAFSHYKLYDWTGFYVGINGGVTFNDVHWFSGPDGVGGTKSVANGLIGGTIGYNLQTQEPLVVGVEADLDWSGIKATVTPPTCLAGCELNVPWLATARLRVGYAFDQILPYMTGGLALGNLSADIVGAPFGTSNTTSLGWTAGAGVEFVISGPLRAKVEYLYVDLSGLTCNTSCSAVAGPVEFNLYSNVIRAGLNYRFGMN